MFKSVTSTKKEDRRRGRPAGKNRVPLSKEERRARNAQYERERRNETAEAMGQLAEAVNSDPHVSNAELLTTVIYRIQRAAQSDPDEITDLRRDKKLEDQLAILESRLGDDAPQWERELRGIEEQEEESQSDSNSNEEPVARLRKYRKLSKTSSISTRRQTGKKIRYTTESSSASNCEWTSESTSQKDTGNETKLSSSSSPSSSSSSSSDNDDDDEQCKKAEVIKEVNDCYIESQGAHQEKETEIPNLSEPVQLEPSLIAQETPLEDSLGLLTEYIIEVLSILLNDNEAIARGIQHANELGNWPGNVEELFNGLID